MLLWLLLPLPKSGNWVHFNDGRWQNFSSGNRIINCPRPKSQKPITSHQRFRTGPGLGSQNWGRTLGGRILRVFLKSFLSNALKTSVSYFNKSSLELPSIIRAQGSLVKKGLEFFFGLTLFNGDPAFRTYPFRTEISAPAQIRPLMLPFRLSR